MFFKSIGIAALANMLPSVLNPGIYYNCSTENHSSETKIKEAIQHVWTIITHDLKENYKQSHKTKKDMLCLLKPI